MTFNNYYMLTFKSLDEMDKCLKICNLSEWREEITKSLYCPIATKEVEMLKYFCKENPMTNDLWASVSNHTRKK